MFFQLICVVMFASPVLGRNVPNFSDLDEEDRILFRAAYDSYDTPYNHEAAAYDAPSYSYDNYNNEIPLSKLDLLKDGMFALKAKIKELKVFNKALAANLLLTKLHLKELLGNLKPLKKHQHIIEVDKKPVYNYQSPSPPSYPQYDQPRPQYTEPASSQQYDAPVPQYTAQHYGPQPPHDPYYGQ